MVSLKLCTLLHTTSHHIHLHFPTDLLSQNPQHPLHATTSFMTFLSPSHQFTGQNLLTKTTNIAHSKLYSTLLKPPTFEKSTKLFPAYTTRPPPLTVHVSIPYSGFTSKHRKQKEVQCPRSNCVPLILLGRESVKTSLPHTTSPTLQLSAQTRLLNGSATTSTLLPGYTNVVTFTTYSPRSQHGTQQFADLSSVSNSHPTRAESQHSTTSSKKASISGSPNSPQVTQLGLLSR